MVRPRVLRLISRVCLLHFENMRRLFLLASLVPLVQNSLALTRSLRTLPSSPRTPTQSKLFALLLVACVAASSASVIFHKSVDTEYFGKNVPATVQLKIYNLGSEYALVDWYPSALHFTFTDHAFRSSVSFHVFLLFPFRDVFDVIVQDKWPKDHFTVVGSMSNKFEMIEAGSNITHTFTVEPTFEGFYSADRAALSYRETREADPTVSYSNPMHNMSVLPNAVYQRLYATAQFSESYLCIVHTLDFGLLLVSYLVILFVRTPAPTSTRSSGPFT